MGDRARLWIMLAIAVAVLVPIRLISAAKRDAMGLQPRTEAEAAGLWETMVNSGTGAFRAFANIALFTRIRDAEEEGEFFLLVDLYERILVVQPHNPAVQVHLAGQMMHTISQKTADEETAWQWVARGKKLLDDATAKNPTSPRLRQAQAHFFHQLGTRYPIRILRRELALGDASVLTREPAWRAEAQTLVAQYDALGPEERTRLDHALKRIGHRLIYEQALAIYPEFNVLSLHARSIYLRFNITRHRLALLAYEAALDPAANVEPDGLPQLAVYAALRAHDLLALTAELPPSDQGAQRAIVWRHAAQLHQFTPQGLPGYPGHAARVATSWHQQNFSRYPPPTDSPGEMRMWTKIFFDDTSHPQTAPNR